MKIAIPSWQKRVSPVLDVAGRFLLVEIVDGREENRAEATLPRQGPVERAKSLAGLGANVLICGAVSRTLEVALSSAGLRVISYTCGEVEEVLAAFLNGRLGQDLFRMPGSFMTGESGRCRRRKSHLRRGRKGPE